MMVGSKLDWGCLITLCKRKSRFTAIFGQKRPNYFPRYGPQKWSHDSDQVAQMFETGFQNDPRCREVTAI